MSPSAAPPPPGRRGVRYFGWLHPAATARRLKVETLLAVVIVVQEKPPEPPPWHLRCPHCGAFALVKTGHLARAPPNRGRHPRRPRRRAPRPLYGRARRLDPQSDPQSLLSTTPRPRQTRQSRPHRRHAQTRHPAQPPPQKSSVYPCFLTTVAGGWLAFFFLTVVTGATEACALKISAFFGAVFRQNRAPETKLDPWKTE